LRALTLRRRRDSIEIADRECGSQSSRMSPLRKISLGIAIAIALLELVIAVITGGARGFLPILVWLVLPMACLLWPEAMGSGTNRWFYPGGWNVTRASPPLVLQVAAWWMLLAPFMYFALIATW
jgi:hypothetical protein